MSGANVRISNPAPIDYVTPGFPSLYWPFQVKPGAASYLYFTTDIWRFTLFWVLIIYAGIHAATLTFALLIRIKFGKPKSKFQWKVALVVSAAYALVAGLEAILAGTGIGFCLGAVYNAGYFRMSTWIPFTWALICSLILILSSFTVGGGL